MITVFFIKQNRNLFRTVNQNKCWLYIIHSIFRFDSIYSIKRSSVKAGCVAKMVNYKLMINKYIIFTINPIDN